jgi:site-specific DNA-methyltransferase (adenine-specific)
MKERPFQIVRTVEAPLKTRFEADGLFPEGLNRLLYGDCLHAMLMLPDEIIDLIYIDPPFFSGRNHNIASGGRETRSFPDKWEGGMPGYLDWLNARLLEMKRLLKPTGSIYVHLDWHAVHYVKCEMDKLFGYNNFRNEIIWYYEGGGGRAKGHFNRKHDTILFYSKTDEFKYNIDNIRVAYKETSMYSFYGTTHHGAGKHYAPDRAKGKNPDDVWIMNILNPSAKERVGYPTQKPLEVIQRIVDAATDEGDVVADFFMGGGTAAEAALGLRSLIGEPLKKTDYCVAPPRRFIGCDISETAVELTAGRMDGILSPDSGRCQIAKKAAKGKNTLAPVAGYTVEHLIESPDKGM